MGSSYLQLLNKLVLPGSEDDSGVTYVKISRRYYLEGSFVDWQVALRQPYFLLLMKLYVLLVRYQIYLPSRLSTATVLKSITDFTKPNKN